MNKDSEGHILPTFLGFDLDAYKNSVQEGGFCDSVRFPYPTAEQMQELEDYAHAKGYKFLVKTDACGAYLLTHLMPHEAVKIGVIDAICDANRQRTGRIFDPVLMFGRDSTTIDAHSCDFSLRTDVANRVGCSPNFILEVQFRSRYSLLDFHRRLVSYMTGDSGIMLIMAVAVLEPDMNSQFVALIALYERGPHNQPIVVQNLSFGSAGVDTDTAACWMDAITQAVTEAATAVGVPPASVPPIQGTRIVDCEPMYTVKLREELLLCTNSDAPFEYNEDAAPNGSEYAVSLYDLQRLTARRFPFQPKCAAHTASGCDTSGQQATIV